MTLSNTLHRKYLQKGATLFLFIVLLILVSGAFLLVLSPSNINQLNKQAQTTYALVQAKQALISYATSNYYRTNPSTGVNLQGLHGYLPCVEGTTPNPAIEGRQTGGCPAARTNSIGRLPWKSLNIEPLKDSAGQCLWYAVSYAYTQSSKLLHNPDSTGMFNLYDISGNKLNSDLPEDRIVAIVIAPGEQLPGQNRMLAEYASPCGQTRDKVMISDYLEGISGHNNSIISGLTDKIDSFVGIEAGRLINNFNDRIITISQQEIFTPILSHIDSAGKSALQNQLIDMGISLGNCLIAYAKLADMLIDTANEGNYKFPWAAPVNLESKFLEDDYRKSINYKDQDLLQIGRFPFIIFNSNLSIGFNPAISLQSNIFRQTKASSVPACTLSDSTFPDRRLWNDWKDQIFYVIADNYTPNTITTSDCASNSCPNINSTNYAALLIIANTRLRSQLRHDSDIEPLIQNSTNLKGSIENYLEAGNLSNFTNKNPRGDFTDNAGNDIQICITATNPPTAKVCP